MKQRHLPCQCCNGSGKRKLSPALQRCMNVVKIRPVTVAQIHRRLREKVDITAINNRMRKLLRLGLVKRTNRIKPFIFKAK